MSAKYRTDIFCGRVRTYIKMNRMLKKGDRIAVGVSGGPDSVCLLYVLAELSGEYDASLVAVHVNHGIRGREADEDEKFTEDLCRRLGIPFRAFHCDVPKMAREKKLTAEEAGRAARRGAFAECMASEKCTKLALAHQSDDVAETMLLNLSRGTGLAGLASLRPVRGNIIRPLLGFSREEILRYLRENGIACRTDSSNEEDVYTRNRIRHHILPYLNSEINSSASEHFAETADRVREALAFIDGEAVERRKLYSVKRKDGFLLKQELFRNETKFMQAEIIRMTAAELTSTLKDVTKEHIQAVMSLAGKQTGRKVMLPYGLSAERGYEGILIRKAQAADGTAGRAGAAEKHGAENACGAEKSGGTAGVSGISLRGWKFTAHEAAEAPDPIPEKPCTKWIDYDKIKTIPVLRTREKGDFLTIAKNGGKKSLSDWFIDEKIPRAERDTLPVLADGHEIIWVSGGRIGETYRITEKTKRILRITIRRNRNG